MSLGCSLLDIFNSAFYSPAITFALFFSASYLIRVILILIYLRSTGWSTFPSIYQYQELGSSWRESSAGIISCITFFWLNPLIDLASRKPLTLEDLWKIPHEDSAENLNRRFSGIM